MTGLKTGVQVLERTINYGLSNDIFSSMVEGFSCKFNYQHRKSLFYKWLSVFLGEIPFHEANLHKNKFDYRTRICSISISW